MAGGAGQVSFCWVLFPPPTPLQSYRCWFICTLHAHLGLKASHCFCAQCLDNTTCLWQLGHCAKEIPGLLTAPVIHSLLCEWVWPVFRTIIRTLLCKGYYLGPARVPGFSLMFGILRTVSWVSLFCHFNHKRIKVCFAQDLFPFWVTQGWRARRGADCFYNQARLAAACALCFQVLLSLWDISFLVPFIFPIPVLPKKKKEHVLFS